MYIRIIQHIVSRKDVNLNKINNVALNYMITYPTSKSIEFLIIRS